MVKKLIDRPRLYVPMSLRAKIVLVNFVSGGFSLESIKNLRIDPDRLWDSLMEMAKIGPGIAGGNNRQTLTDEDAEGRALFQKWCKDAGMEMGLDTMGNMFATRAGSDPDALPVYVGSHLDTQPTGGNMMVYWVFWVV